MKPKIVINIGIPASGKSTCSAAMVEDPTWVKTGRDDFRYMLTDKGVCSGKIEQIITKIQRNLVSECVNSGLNVIIDNCNCNYNHIITWKELVGETADVFYKLFRMPVDAAIIIDSRRARSVGPDVIKKFSGMLATLDFDKIHKFGIKNFDQYVEHH